MAVMSLDDLKAENETEEVEAAAAPQVTDAETETESVEDKPEVDQTAAELDGDPDTVDETDESEADDWKKPDGHTSEKLFTSRDIRAARIKAGEKADRRNSGEVEELQKRIVELEGRSAKPDTLSRPKRDQFFEADDPDTAYEDAVLDWMKGTVQAEQSASNASAEITRQNSHSFEETGRAVDEHYERAAKLAQDSGISAELYQQSDLKVREMIESIYPGGGDNIADELIKQLGEGSEKVMFSIGIKQSRLDELKNRLLSDPRGIKAALYLGSLNTELNAPHKRKTTAPAPADTVEGDMAPQNGKVMKKQYDALHKSGDIGKAFNAKMAAKAAGVNTADW